MIHKIDRRVFMTMLAGSALAPVVGYAADSQRAMVVDMVDQAANAIQTHGFPGALRHTETSVWRRVPSGLYVFVIDREGNLHLHPDKKMEGASVLGSTDPSGKKFIRDIIARTAKTSDGIWSDYVWPSPKTRELAQKHTYARAAGDFIAAAGYYAKST